jgi:hypothetical protein
MIGINHYLVGVGTAVVLKNPLLAVPVAFASHFALDVLPHFGIAEDEPGRGKLLARVGYVDAALVFAAMVMTIINYPAWYVLIGLTAMSPDFAWIYRFIVQEKFGTLPPRPHLNWFNAWHARIQKLEFKWGIIIDTVVSCLLGWLLFFA